MTTEGHTPDALLALLVALPAEARAARLRASGPLPETFLLVADHVERLAVTEVTRAIEGGELLVALAERLDDPLCRTRAHRVRGQTLAYSGRAADALAEFQAAVEAAGAAELAVEGARARMSSIHALATLGRFEEAIAAGEAARAAFDGAGEPALAARADSNLGATYQMCDNPAMALRHFERARPALLAEPGALAQVDSNRGHALLHLDRFREAEEAYRAALPIFEQAQMSWAAAIVEGNLAELATRQGRFQEALYHFERTRRHLEHDSAPGELARVLVEQAEALALIGVPGEAVNDFQNALRELRAGGLKLEMAKALSGLARAYLRMERHEEAEATLTEARAAHAELGQPTAVARIDILRSELALRRGDAERAAELARSALAALHERSAQTLLARHQLARAAHLAGRSGEALDQLNAAIPVATELGLTYVLADLLHARARVLRADGRVPEALADSRTAIEQVERVRGALQAERFRAAFHGDRLALYDELVRLALEAGGDVGAAEAFHAVEKAKSRALLDLVHGRLDLATATRASAGEAESELLGELVRRREDLNSLYSRLADAAFDEAPPEKAAHWRREVAENETALERLEARLAATRGVAGLYAPAIDATAVMAELPADAALVEYFLADGQLLAFVLRGGRLRVLRDLVEAEDLAELVRRVQFQIRRGLRGPGHAGRDQRLLEDARRELAALHDAVWRPLAAELDGVRMVTIVPHGPLHGAPLHALWDGRRHLIETTAVAYAPSASVWAYTRRVATERTRGRRAVVIGVPDASAPLIEREAERVAEVLGAERVLIGRDASVAAFAEAAREADIVHVACHGHFAAENPRASGLRLADRWLNTQDVYGLRLRAGLLTLSGCETGRNVIGAGDELMGLVRAFFAAGASALVVSYWKVSDESTAELMAELYRRYATPGGDSELAEDLRGAQRALLSARPHPAFWAPFALIGAGG